MLATRLFSVVYRNQEKDSKIDTVLSHGGERRGGGHREGEKEKEGRMRGREKGEEYMKISFH